MSQIVTPLSPTSQIIRARAVQSLRAQDGKSYTPANIMDSWTQRVPDGSKAALNLAITQQAIEIMTDESTTAYHNNTALP